MANEVKLSDELCAKLTAHIDSKLTGNVTRVTQDQLFDDLKDLIVAEIPESSKSRFKAAMGHAMKAGRIPGFKGKQGRTGGIVRVASGDSTGETKEESEPAPAISVKQETSSFSFKGREYLVNMSKDKLETMLTKVFKCRNDSDGNVVLNNETYSLEENNSELLDNFAFYFGSEQSQENEQQSL